MSQKRNKKGRQKVPSDKNKITIYQSFWDATKPVQREVYRPECLPEEKRSQINNITMSQGIKKKNPKYSRRKEVIQIRAGVKERLDTQ